MDVIEYHTSFSLDKAIVLRITKDNKSNSCGQKKGK